MEHAALLRLLRKQAERWRKRKRGERALAYVHAASIVEKYMAGIARKGRP